MEGSEPAGGVRIFLFVCLTHKPKPKPTNPNPKHNFRSAKRSVFSSQSFKAWPSKCKKASSLEVKESHIDPIT